MRDHPEISPSVLERIAPRVHDPDYILRSATDPDSIIAVPVELADGRVMVVSIRKDQRDAQGRPINLITSVYLKDDPQWLAREAAAGRMLYAKAGYRSTGQSPNQPGSDSPYVQPRRADLTRSSKKKILTRADVFKSREFDQTRRGSIVFPAGGPDGAQSVINLFEQADLSTLLHETAHTIAVELDGLQETGAVYDELLADVYEGEKLEAAMRIEMEQKMSAIIGEHYTRKQVAAMKVARNVPGASSRLWSKAEILSVALNTGNEQNFQRLTDQTVTQSERLTREQVDALLSTLDENDWRFVQAYWDHIDSYAPQLAEVHKRRTGVEMKKVEGKQMAAAPAFVRGGYYPIQYDPTKSARAMVDQASLWDRVMSSGRGGKPEVNSGRTMERQQTGGGRALRFDLGVGIEGMRETIRIVSLSEAVDNSARLLRDGEVKQVFLDRQLGHEWTMLDLTLQDVAAGPIFHNFWGEKAARVIKNNVSSMFLGLNLKTTLLQATGAAQSAAVIGNRNLARGYLEYMQHRGDLLRRIKGVSSFMAEREKTVNKDFADMMADPANTNPVRGRLAMTISTAKQIGYVPIQKMQYYSVDVPTWAGAYLSQIEAGRTEAEAVSYADLMVDRSQGGSFMSSRSAWARGTVSSELRQSAMIRIFTTLAGYMITKLNRGVIETERGIKGVRDGGTVADKVSSAANMALNLTLLYVVEGLVMGLMWAMLDDDDEPEDLLKYTLEETGMSMVGGFPIIRDVWGFATEGRGAGGMHETIGAIPGKFWQQMAQGENDKAFRRSAGDGVGLVTGLPTTATMRMIEGLIGEDDMTWAEMFLGKNPLTR